MIGVWRLATSWGSALRPGKVDLFLVEISSVGKDMELEGRAR
jgi:hypothetical protein